MPYFKEILTNVALSKQMEVQRSFEQLLWGMIVYHKDK